MDIDGRGFFDQKIRGISKPSAENVTGSGMADIWKLAPISQYFCSGDIAFAVAFAGASRSV